MRDKVTRTAIAIFLLSLVLMNLNVSTGTARAFGYSSLFPIQKRLLSGLAEQELNTQQEMNPASITAVMRVSGSDADHIDAEATEAGNAVQDSMKVTAHPRNYFPRQDSGCSIKFGSNIKVNQGCLNLSDPSYQGRGQAVNGAAISYDPRHPNHVIAAYNDHRRGDSTCGTAYSLDKGHTWVDVWLPTSYTRGQPTFAALRQYWQSGGDTSVAWDTKGNAYITCLVFNRGGLVSSNPDLSTAVLILRSTQASGASWNFPGRIVTESNDLAGNGTILEDKPSLTIDNHDGSTYQDRVYVTWTEFDAHGSSYIWEAYSADYGETFSPRHLVSSTSPLCVNTFGFGTEHGTCNENQASHPFTGPDGALYVVFVNFNNAVNGSDNRNQILLAKSVDGGNSFSLPVKVGDFYDLPDCAMYQDGLNSGRSCVPEKGNTTNSYFRVSNYPVGAVNPVQPNQVIVSFGSYINKNSNEMNGCGPAGTSTTTGLNQYSGVKTPGACNNDILVSVSNDGGQTFTGTTADPRDLTSISQQAGQETTDQWWQWMAFTKTGRLVVSYYDRKYGDAEMTGFVDMSIAWSSDLVRFRLKRVTSSSMPPPTQFGGTFMGDYSGLTVIDDDAFPVWTDTRNPELFLCSAAATTIAPAVCTSQASNAPIANTQDLFTASVDVPLR